MNIVVPFSAVSVRMPLGVRGLEICMERRDTVSQGSRAQDDGDAGAGAGAGAGAVVVGVN